MNRSVIKYNFPQKINCNKWKIGVTVHALQSNSHLSLESTKRASGKDEGHSNKKLEIWQRWTAGCWQFYWMVIGSVMANRFQFYKMEEAEREMHPDSQSRQKLGINHGLMHDLLGRKQNQNLNPQWTNLNRPDISKMTNSAKNPEYLNRFLTPNIVINGTVML